MSQKSVGRVAGKDGEGVIVSGFKVRLEDSEEVVCACVDEVIPVISSVPDTDIVDHPSYCSTSSRVLRHFKIHHGHITHKNYNVFLDVVRERRATIISLIRRNTLEAWISFLISTGTWQRRTLVDVCLRICVHCSALHDFQSTTAPSETLPATFHALNEQPGNYKTNTSEEGDSGNVVTWGERSHEKAKLQHEKLVVWVEVGNYMKYRKVRMNDDQKLQDESTRLHASLIAWSAPHGRSNHSHVSVADKCLELSSCPPPLSVSDRRARPCSLMEEQRSRCVRGAKSSWALYESNPVLLRRRWDAQGRRTRSMFPF